MQRVNSLPNLKRIRSEALSQNDLAKNPIDDVVARCLAEREENSLVFYQKIDRLPFSVHLFFHESLKFLRETQKRNKFVVLNIDATGGVLRSPVASPLLHHVLLLPVKAHQSNKSTVPFNLAELITEDNTCFNIEHFLSHVKAKFQFLFPGQKLASAIVTDKSYANINAIVKSQNLMSLRKYLKLMFDIFIDEEKYDCLTEIVMVQLCSSHQCKNWKQDVLSFYGRSLAKSDINFICSLMGHLMNIRTKEEVDSYVNSLFTFLCSRRKNEEYKTALKIMIDSATELESFKSEFDAIDTKDYVSADTLDEGFGLTEKEAIYKTSSFYAHFGQFLEKLKLAEDQNEIIENRFFNPAYAEDFLKKNLSLFPLWSAIFSKHRDGQYKRFNNGHIEGYFSHLKQNCERNIKLSKLGTIKIGRYIAELKENVLISMSRVQFNLPDHNLTRSKYRGNSSNRSHSAETENWMRKSNAGIFSSTANIVKEGGKYDDHIFGLIFHNFNLLRKFVERSGKLF